MYLAVLNFVVILTLVGGAFSIVMMHRGVMAARSAERRFNEAREALDLERRQVRQERNALGGANPGSPVHSRSSAPLNR